MSGLLKTQFKRCSPEIARQQLEWYGKRPVGDVPTVKSITEEGYAYYWVEGECPVDVDYAGQLIEWCRRRLWTFGNGVLLPLHVAAYSGYCRSVAREVGLRQVAEWIGDHIGKCLFTPCRACHGDLTLENVVRTGSKFVFIDPGFDRGLPCVELDLAKIGQSMQESGIDEPALIRPLEVRLLLVTHYVRLLRHRSKHPIARAEHALRRIGELTQ